ncbi:MAG: hypothetical protein AB7U81_06770 [Thiohalomonadaceae bacterium]
MKQLRGVLGMLLVALGLSGCVYMHTDTPGALQSLTSYELSSGDFKVIGPVSATGEVTLWFGAVMTGGKGYQALLDEARRLGGDAIMNYSFDFEQESVLLFIWAKYRWKAEALAVRLADDLKLQGKSRNP